MEQQTDVFIPDGMNAFQRNVKRVGDCLIAFVALIVFSPLFLYCYLAVKREDGGPAIFKQERIGRFGKPFYIYKFRSMRLDAEKFGPALYKGGEDSRLTKIGKILREHHLDELPQLWNVFVGDMAFIGPDLNGNSILTKLWNVIHVIVFFIRFVRELHPTPRFIMVTRIQWKKCSVVFGMTCSI